MEARPPSRCARRGQSLEKDKPPGGLFPRREKLSRLLSFCIRLCAASYAAAAFPLSGPWARRMGGSPVPLGQGRRLGKAWRVSPSSWCRNTLHLLRLLLPLSHLFSTGEDSNLRKSSAYFPSPSEYPRPTGPRHRPGQSLAPQEREEPVTAESLSALHHHYIPPPPPNHLKKGATLDSQSRQKIL